MVQHLCKEACHVGASTETEKENIVVIIALSMVSESAPPIRKERLETGTFIHGVGSGGQIQSSELVLKEGTKSPIRRTCIKNL